MSEKLEERKIAAWFTQVYPDTVELSMATKDLNEVMEDTALLIADLKSQLSSCQKELAEAKQTIIGMIASLEAKSGELAEAKQLLIHGNKMVEDRDKEIADLKRHIELSAKAKER